ncbi:hypothetical protein HPB51_005857 [Rhipicephalus microplus]|uniref:N-acetyltransferase domain-containing protein n=1 Tax=Rhipicephalus microplus TaxID=6941 RepID=A0A9J6D464_RHIMP|nr:hypothetical protein HPB51_005857 [Rhipicephalus microplus]
MPRIRGNACGNDKRKPRGQEKHHKRKSSDYFAQIEGRVVATCACVRQHETLFFVGMYAVRKHLQGRGIGIRLWRTMARRLGDCNAGLNAVPKHLSTYRDHAGFGHLDTWNTLVYSGTAVSTDKLARPTEELRAVPVTANLLPEVYPNLRDEMKWKCLCRSRDSASRTG